MNQNAGRPTYRLLECATRNPARRSTIEIAWDLPAPAGMAFTIFTSKRQNNGLSLNINTTVSCSVRSPFTSSSAIHPSLFVS